mmetsp:Transcript_40913/g.80651  ORF Transcript_40913/g.80651 Transcript_40913/m.80651 type:complete len:81 (+) Transcript_40913:336-578(+)
MGTQRSCRNHFAFFCKRREPVRDNSLWEKHRSFIHSFGSLLDYRYVREELESSDKKERNRSEQRRVCLGQAGGTLEALAV